MLSYEECLQKISESIRGKFITYSHKMNNGKYSFLYFNEKVGKGKDEMPCCPNEIIIDPTTGKIENGFDRIAKGWEAFDRDGTPEGDKLLSEIVAYSFVEDTVREIMSYC